MSQMTTENISTVRLLKLRSFKAATPNRSSTSVKNSCLFGSVRSISKSFGLRLSCCCKASAMAIYRVKLIGPNGEENELHAPDDVYTIESAENVGVEMPYSCKAGACSTCAGLMVLGLVDQSDGMILDEEQMEKGYLLTCVSYPKSDCVIHTHREGDLYSVECNERMKSLD